MVKSMTSETAKRYRDLYKSSLCFYCKHSSPKKCNWIGQNKPIYKVAEKQMITLGRRNRQTIKVESVIVKECDHFEVVDS